MAAPVRDPTQEDSQADGILRFILENRRFTRKQIAWLCGYVRRLRARVKKPQDNEQLSQG